MILGLGWAGALRERHLVHLDPAAHVDAEVLVGAFHLESVIPLRRHSQVTADLVGLLRLLFILRGILRAGVLAGRLGGGNGDRLDSFCRLLFEFRQSLFEGGHFLPVVLEGRAHVVKRIEAGGDARKREGRSVVGLGDHQIGLGSRQEPNARHEGRKECQGRRSQTANPPAWGVTVFGRAVDHGGNLWVQCLLDRQSR